MSKYGNDPDPRGASLIMIGGITAVIKVVVDLAEDFDAEDFLALREEPGAQALIDYLRGNIRRVQSWASRGLDVLDEAEDAFVGEDEEDGA